MAYTVIGMFPNFEDAEKASNKLDNNGFEKEDYSVSRYSRSEEVERDIDYDYDEDENTTGFWSWLFGEDEDRRKRYSYAGTRSNMVTVYTDDMDRAEKARDIMNDMGAINVNDFTKEYYPEAGEFTTSNNNTIDASERARIINKARNNAYMTGSDRTYGVRRRTGIQDTMDSTGDTV